VMPPAVMQSRDVAAAVHQEGKSKGGAGGLSRTEIVQNKPEAGLKPSQKPEARSQKKRRSQKVKARS
jgi:hypothetical protein